VIFSYLTSHVQVRFIRISLPEMIMSTNLRLTPVVLFLLISAESCHTTKTAVELKGFGPDSFVISGMMVHIALEGGCWQFRDNSGEHFELSADKAFSSIWQDSTNAELIVRPVTFRSVCMTGKQVSVLKIIHLSH